MAKILTLDEMLDIIIQQEPDAGSAYRACIEAIATKIANDIAVFNGVACTEATFEGADLAGVAAAFGPHEFEDEIPPALADYDQDSDWLPIGVLLLKHEVRHDMHGYYVCTVEEAAHENQGNASAGFDGRQHYATLGEANRAAAALEKKE